MPSSDVCTMDLFQKWNYFRKQMSFLPWSVRKELIPLYSTYFFKVTSNCLKQYCG